jgi:hypothetical protein
MSFIEQQQLTRQFSRKYAEEVEMAFSGIDCVLNGEKAIYASSELTTGRRVHSVLREIGARQSSELRPRLGELEYQTRIWDPNVEAAMAFARQLHHSLGGNQLVITPAPFMAPGWNQQEYLAFWELLLRSRIKGVYFNEGWEYSNGCTFEFMVAADHGLPTFDAAGIPLALRDATAQVSEAVKVLQSDRLDADVLARTLNQMRDLAVRRDEIRRVSS